MKSDDVSLSVTVKGGTARSYIQYDAPITSTARTANCERPGSHRQTATTPCALVRLSSQVPGERAEVALGDDDPQVLVNHRQHLLRVSLARYQERRREQVRVLDVHGDRSHPADWPVVYRRFLSMLYWLTTEFTSRA
jgi:hypothetical protein